MSLEVDENSIEIEDIADTLPHEYVRKGLLEHLSALMDCYEDPNDLFLTKDVRGMNLLHIAVIKGMYFGYLL